MLYFIYGNYENHDSISVLVLHSLIIGAIMIYILIRVYEKSSTSIYVIKAKNIEHAIQLFFSRPSKLHFIGTNNNGKQTRFS